MNTEHLITDLWTYLTNYAGLVALQGQRLYPIQLQQGCSLPASTYMIVDVNQQYSHGGLSLAQPRVQFDVYGSTYLQTHQVADQLVTALTGWFAAFRLGAFVQPPRDLPEPPELNRYRCVVDVQIWRQ